MQGQRGLEPNDIVFGCMLDALVCNNQVDEAVKLFVASTQTIIYSYNHTYEYITIMPYSI